MAGSWLEVGAAGRRVRSGGVTAGRRQGDRPASVGLAHRADGRARHVPVAVRARRVSGASGAEPEAVRLRLTRRGRRAVTALVLVAATFAVLLAATLVRAGGGAGLELAGGSSVVVQPGDTVWSIATAVAGDGQDVRAVVDAIERLNELEAALVVPGQVLELP